MSRLNESEKLRQNFPELDRAVAATRSLLVDDRILHLLDYSQRQSNYTRSVLDTAVGDVGKFTMTREGPICWLGGSEIDQNVEIQLLPRLSGFTIFAFKGPRWVDYVDKALLKKIISGSLSSQEHEQLKQQSGLIYRDRDKNPVFVDTNIILAVAALKNSSCNTTDIDPLVQLLHYDSEFRSGPRKENVLTNLLGTKAYKAEWAKRGSKDELVVKIHDPRFVSTDYFWWARLPEITDGKDKYIPFGRKPNFTDWDVEKILS